MEDVVRHIDCNKTKQHLTTHHEAEDSHECVDDAENLSRQACLHRSHPSDAKEDDARGKVNDVMKRIHFEDTEQGRGHDKSEDAYEREDCSEDIQYGLCHVVVFTKDR